MTNVGLKTIGLPKVELPSVNVVSVAMKDSEKEEFYYPADFTCIFPNQSGVYPSYIAMQENPTKLWYSSINVGFPISELQLPAFEYQVVDLDNPTDEYIDAECQFSFGVGAEGNIYNVSNVHPTVWYLSPEHLWKGGEQAVFRVKFKDWSTGNVVLKQKAIPKGTVVPKYKVDFMTFFDYKSGLSISALDFRKDYAYIHYFTLGSEDITMPSFEVEITGLDEGNEYVSGRLRDRYREYEQWKIETNGIHTIPEVVAASDSKMLSYMIGLNRMKDSNAKLTQIKLN